MHRGGRVWRVTALRLVVQSADLAGREDPCHDRALVTGRSLARRAAQRRVPEAATTTAFLDFAIRSCGVRRAGIAAAAGLYPLFLSFMLVWRYQTGTFASIGAYLWSGRMLVIAAVTGVLAVLAMRRYRALGRELDNLRAMQQRFENGGGPG